ncbi:MAG: 2,3-bisphosphoglycerate-independent phosphoglycerate mutase, partial [Candidatus Azambacteria bacterium]|nr:2,3-bisphosphoglycerate-independent phosphoglycerate mutase [Candidatus Azambacteria bacterium]
MKNVVLIVLDGWGLSPSWGGNALAMNNPKTIDSLWKNYPHAVLQALSVVSNSGPVCDSRLGHMLIGTGRKVESSLERINKSIRNRSFFRNETLLGAIRWAQENNSNLHLLGMISDGGVHSHINHLFALLELAKKKNFKRVYIDAITDGTDSGATDALRYIEKIQAKIKSTGVGSFSSIGGRAFGMDRDEHWDRTSRYQRALIDGKCEKYKTINEAVSANYRRGVNDEFIEPALILQEDAKEIKIKANDAIVFFNFREDRARQLTRLFIDPHFKKFLWIPRKIEDLYFATFIDYEKKLPAKIVFPEADYNYTLSEILSERNLRQLKIAESEKYAHVTYFFNGGNEDAYPGEERKIISSPSVDSYANAPAMSAKKVGEEIVKAIKSKRYGLIMANFANVDMVAHTGNILAVGKAV